MLAQKEEAGQLELFCGGALGFADTNWLRLFDVQLNATPGLRWRMGHDWSIAFQGLIPIVSTGYTYREIENKYWRVNMATVSRQIHFNKANQHLKLTAGLFGKRRYGIDAKWAWPVNDWLLLNAEAGITSSWIMGTDFCGNYDVDFHGGSKITGIVGADVYLHPYNIELRMSGGRYIYGDYGSQIELMRHFKHCTLLTYVQLRIGELTSNIYDNKSYRTNGGFAITWILPPYRKSSRKVVMRPASFFQQVYSARSDGQSMKLYSVDPEENKREHQIDVDWGLRKEVAP